MSRQPSAFSSLIASVKRPAWLRRGSRAWPLVLTMAAAVLVLVTAIVSLGLYWNAKLGPLLGSPEVHLVPVSYEPQPPAFPLQQLDLGYARIAVPWEIGGKLVALDDHWIGLDALGREGITISFGRPMRAPDLVTAVDLRAALAGVSSGRHYCDLQLAAFAARPFSIWSIPLLGPDETLRRSALLTIKMAELNGISAIHVYSSEQLVVIVKDGREQHIIDITDRRHGVMQTILLQRSATTLSRVLDALIASYAPTTDDFSDAHLAQLRDRVRIAPAGGR